MNILSFNKGRPDAVFRAAEGLAALWEQAEAYGKVRLEHSTFGSGYDAQIMFKNRNGSLIFAKAEHKDRDTAMRLAIEEAVSLGAAPK